MAIKTAFNTTDRPQVCDDEGHVIAGGERGEADDECVAVQQAVAAGVLVFVKTNTSAEPIAEEPSEAVEELEAPKPKKKPKKPKKSAIKMVEEAEPTLVDDQPEPTQEV